MTPQQIELFDEAAMKRREMLQKSRQKKETSSDILDRDEYIQQLQEAREDYTERIKQIEATLAAILEGEQG